MRKVGLLLGLSLGVLSTASAQIAVETVLDQDQFLSGESIVAAIRVSNRSGQTLHLGETQDWLKIFVEGRNSLIVEKTGDPPVVGAFDLDSAKVAIKRVDLAPYFNLTTPGHYAITVTVRVKEWGQEFTSKPKGFDVLRGAALWWQDFGVPKPGNALPEMRRYALQQARYLRQLKLYVRVTDAAETKVIRVFPLGPMVSFGQPEPQVDKHSNLHVLYQNSARGFLYSVINPDGQLIVSQTFDYADTRPKLALSDAGEVVVAGGVRRFTPNDIPPSPPYSDFTNAVAPPKP